VPSEITKAATPAISSIPGRMTAIAAATGLPFGRAAAMAAQPVMSDRGRLACPLRQHPQRDNRGRQAAHQRAQRAIKWQCAIGRGDGNGQGGHGRRGCIDISLMLPMPSIAPNSKMTMRRIWSSAADGVDAGGDTGRVMTLAGSPWA
jgi:hypothetical protein